MEQLSQRRKIIEADLEKIKSVDNMGLDVDEAVNDLRNRLESFNRGWKKAGAVARRSLLKKLIHSIEVPPDGLVIEFYLKHGLNASAAEIGEEWTEYEDNKVIYLKDKRIAPAESSILDSTGFHSSFDNLQDVVIGVTDTL